jgi:porin
VIYSNQPCANTSLKATVFIRSSLRSVSGAASIFFASTLFAAGIVTPAKAQSMDSWLTQPTMTGDWNGYRTKLNNIGIVPFADYLSENADVLSGGERQGDAYVQTLTIGTNINLQTLAGLEGTLFHFTLNAKEGTDAGDDFIGDNATLNPQESFGGGETEGMLLVRLTELSIEKTFAGGLVNAHLGFYPLGNDFAGTPILCPLFQNVAFCAHPQNLPHASSGFSDAPTGKWGGRLKLFLTPALYGETGVFDVNPTYTEPGNGLKIGLSGSTGVIIPLEFGLTTAFGPAKLPGHYRIGAYYDTSATPNVAIPGQIDDGAYGAYAIADQILYSFNGGPNRGLLGFVQLSFSDARTATVTSAFGGGFAAIGIFDARPADSIQIGYYQLGINHRLINEQRAELTAEDITNEEAFEQGESVIETGYSFQATPWLEVHPNLQYIDNPGTFVFKHIPDAWVFGVQTKVTF